MACVILVPQPEIEPGSFVLKVWSLNDWTAREVSSRRLSRAVGQVMRWRPSWHGMVDRSEQGDRLIIPKFKM